MKWELDALRVLAKNPTVPGVALQDAIGEIDRLNKVIQKQKDLISQMGNVAGEVSKDLKGRVNENLRKPE